MLVVVGEGLVGLILADLALRLPFKMLLGIVRRFPVMPWGRTTPERVSQLCAAIDESTIWYFKRVECLQRSVCTTVLLRFHGISADMIIGYRQFPFESHAWVEVDREIVSDRRQYCRLFEPIERIEATPR